jgi:hypothetical protein
LFANKTKSKFKEEEMNTKNKTMIEAAFMKGIKSKKKCHVKLQKKKNADG